MKKTAILGSVIATLMAACSSYDGGDGAMTSQEELGSGTYNFGALASPGKCLDVAAAGSADGTNVQQYQCNGTGAQSWRVEGIGGGNVRLVNTPTGKCLDVFAAGTADRTNIQLYSCNGTGAQSFRIDDAGGGNVRLVNTNSNKCVDVDGAGKADGTNVQLYTCNGTVAQLWRPADIGGIASGGGSGGGSSGGSGGGSGGGSAGGSSGGSSFGANLPADPNGVWIRVKNNCGFPIWVHGAGSSGTLQPDDAQLDTGTSRNYLAPKEWSAARVTAFVDGPRQTELEKAEMTLGSGVLNYNVTYVDWLGLPLEIVGAGGNCNASQHTTGCYAKQATVNASCPEGFLRQGKKCLAARTFCLDPNNQGNPYCHALDGLIATTPGAHGTTAEAYACSGTYGQDPRMCAALNRGMTKDPDNANASLYYKNPPFNTYSKFVHDVCPDIYAFPYDDWQSHGGFRSCSGTELRITFCPSG